MTELLDERRARLGAAIEAARARAASRRDLDWAEIGDLLDSLSHELNEVTHIESDHRGLHARYDAFERRLGEISVRLGEDSAAG